MREDAEHEFETEERHGISPPTRLLVPKFRLDRQPLESSLCNISRSVLARETSEERARARYVRLLA